MKEKENPCSKKCNTRNNKIRTIPESRCRGSQPLSLLKASGFTLLEVIVAIIIIGALLAFALPKYETALDKSRFSTLMPLTKSIKDAEEVFYIASNQYTEDVSSLDVKVNPGETVQVSVKDDDDYSYVQAIDPRIENIYKAYLKHSTNFPEERHCEALSDSSRAKKVCETLGGTLLDESGEYTVYVLEGTGHGSVNTEKQCEGEPPSTEQACSSGCGTQTRSVSCDTSTGEWDLGDWTGTCPEQGEPSQSCTNGVGTETRTFTCEGNSWVAGEWDKSSCTCDPEEKPKETQTCTTGVGTETRSVTCNGTTWEMGTWDKSSCTCDPKTKPAVSEACTYGGTKTRNVECDANNLTWTYGTWDESACECDADHAPDTEKACDSGCGSQTRENTCVNGQWQEGTWTACADKPATSQSCSDGCRTGTQTRTVTCQANGTWKTGTFGTCSVTKPSDSSSSCSGIYASGYTYSGGTYTTTYTCNNGSWKSSTSYANCTGGCLNRSKPANITGTCADVGLTGSGTVEIEYKCVNGTWTPATGGFNDWGDWDVTTGSCKSANCTFVEGGFMCN